MNNIPSQSSAQAAHNLLPNNDINCLPHILFASHNVRSFSNVAKQNSLIELFSSLHLDIIGLQETNFSLSSIKPFNRHFASSYVGFFGIPSLNYPQKSGFGVGILLRPLIANHVFHHESYENRIILVDLQFANKQKYESLTVIFRLATSPQTNYSNGTKQVHS